MKSSPTPLTQVKRIPNRGHYDFETVAKILDENFIAHIGFNHDGQTVIIPTLYVRVGSAIYIHGSSVSRMLKTVIENQEKICVTVTSFQALVMARSAFHHSMNYRSVVCFGKAALIETPQEKNDALFKIMEHLTPGRWNEVREPSAQELKATSVVKIEIEEASAKIREGNPKDDDEDMTLDVWAGLLPIETNLGTPIPDEYSTQKSVSHSVLLYKLPHERK